MEFKDGVLHTGLPASETRRVYNAFREAIEDGLIKVKKPIGCFVVTFDVMPSNSAVDRNIAIRENMLTLGNNVSKLIFAKDAGDIVTSCDTIGEMTSSNAKFLHNGHEVLCLTPDMPLLHSFNKVRLQLILSEDVGYKDVQENAAKLQSMPHLPDAEKYFPLNSDHTLIDVVRILPLLDDGVIRYKAPKYLEPVLNSMWGEYYAKL